MTRLIMPIILIVISFSIFFVLAQPIYNDISSLKTEIASYDDALNNSKALENERDKLTAKYNSIIPANLTKLEKLLPENVDNIRLILEIGQIAAPYNMVLKDIKYDTTIPVVPTTGGIVPGSGGANINDSKNYGSFDLAFSASGTYNDFIAFTKDLESNLRIVDVSSLAFSSSPSGVGLSTKIDSTETYRFDFKIKTYYLKD